MLAGFGVDVLDPAVSLRRIHVLLDRLPPAVRRDGQYWSTEAKLTACLIDAVQALHWSVLQFMGAKGQHGGDLPKLKPFEQPPELELARGPAAGSPVAARPAAPKPDGRKFGSWAEAMMAIAGVEDD